MNLAFSRTVLRRLMLLAALVASIGSVHARNTKLLQPLDTNPPKRDVALRFGKASSAGVEIVQSLIEAHGVASPDSFTVPTSTNSGSTRRIHKSDEEVCLDAFRIAVAELQQRARASGANAVVGIVSNYEHVEFDSTQMYECHVGMTRAVVDLKGQGARLAVQPVAAAAPQAAPAAPVAPMPVPAVAPAAAQPGSIPMIASGFANINDVDAIPYLSDRGRADYRDWLTKPTPRAFAISADGYWYGAWSIKPRDPSQPVDPSERALLLCSQKAPAPCKLYAVNGSVVWVKP